MNMFSLTMCFCTVYPSLRVYQAVSQLTDPKVGECKVWGAGDREIMCTVRLFSQKISVGQ